ncbi:uncharacterized protein LOC34618717 [Cyclospora cayetanensis]|uniref:Uncharacterized protein LOC34618717 n=1 Tax=Cyclospora cayetanensis TaxID=88456 RepID=A0A6P6RV02_9EIME|nr:uncharacterized protein LOC34618717 [Cyclospora cayetanensis]
MYPPLRAIDRATHLPPLCSTDAPGRIRDCPCNCNSSACLSRADEGRRNAASLQQGEPPAAAAVAGNVAAVYFPPARVYDRMRASPRRAAGKSPLSRSHMVLSGLFFDSKGAPSAAAAAAVAAAAEGAAAATAAAAEGARPPEARPELSPPSLNCLVDNATMAAAVAACALLSRQRQQQQRQQAREDMARRARALPHKVGVKFDPTCPRWIAHWKRDGQRFFRSFSVEKNGFEEAWHMAVKCRRENCEDYDYNNPTLLQNGKTHAFRAASPAAAAAGRFSVDTSTPSECLPAAAAAAAAAGAVPMPEDDAGRAAPSAAICRSWGSPRGTASDCEKGVKNKLRAKVEAAASAAAPTTASTCRSISDDKAPDLAAPPTAATGEEALSSAKGTADAAAGKTDSAAAAAAMLLEAEASLLRRISGALRSSSSTCRSCHAQGRETGSPMECAARALKEALRQQQQQQQQQQPPLLAVAPPDSPQDFLGPLLEPPDRPSGVFATPTTATSLGSPALSVARPAGCARTFAAEARKDPSSPVWSFGAFSTPQPEESLRESAEETVHGGAPQRGCERSSSLAFVGSNSSARMFEPASLENSLDTAEAGRGGLSAALPSEDGCRVLSSSMEKEDANKRLQLVKAAVCLLLRDLRDVCLLSWVPYYIIEPNEEFACLSRCLSLAEKCEDEQQLQPFLSVFSPLIAQRKLPSTLPVRQQKDLLELTVQTAKLVAA